MMVGSVPIFAVALIRHVLAPAFAKFLIAQQNGRGPIHDARAVARMVNVVDAFKWGYFIKAMASNPGIPRPVL